MLNEPVSSIMTANLLTVSPHQKLTAVLELLEGHRIHHVPVVDGRKLVGLITTYDLFKLNRLQSDYDNIEVKDVMTTKLATLEPSAKIGTAAEVFLENYFHALPIVNEDGDLLGIVTTFDTLKYMYYKEYPWEKRRMEGE